MASSSLNKPAILVIGGDSMIGGVLADDLARDGVRHWSSTRRLDLRSPSRPMVDLAASDWRDLDTLDADVAIICAASARLAQCHADPEGTYAVNVTGTVALARGLVARGTRVIYLSTNQVLDGAVPLAPLERAYAPASIYGQQKAAAEQALLTLSPLVAILRLAKVFGPADGLLGGWCRGLAAGTPITPFSDMTMAPVSAELVASALWRMGGGQTSGLYQLSADGDVSYAALAHALAEKLGAPATLIRPVPAGGPTIVTQPPPYTSLDSTRLAHEFGIVPPQPLSVIDALLEGRRHDD